MRFLVHKERPQLAMMLTHEEWQTNQYRAAEWVHTVNAHPAYRMEVSSEGVVGVSGGQYGGEMVVLIDFTTLDQIREFMLSRRVYTQEQFVQLCIENGRDPNQYMQSAQAGSGPQMFFF